MHISVACILLSTTACRHKQPFDIITGFLFWKYLICPQSNKAMSQKILKKFKIHIKRNTGSATCFAPLKSLAQFDQSHFFAMTIVTIAKIVIIFIILDHTYDNHHNPDCHHIYDPLSLSSPCRITPHHDFHTDVTLYTEQCGLSSAISCMMLILCRLTSI